MEFPLLTLVEHVPFSSSLLHPLANLLAYIILISYITTFFIMFFPSTWTIS